MSSYRSGSLLTITDHEVEPKMTFSRMMALVAMAFLWTGSQIPVYLFGGVSWSSISDRTKLTFRFLPTSTATLEAPIDGSGWFLPTFFLLRQSALLSDPFLT